jgi:hypothetical protein
VEQEIEHFEKMVRDYLAGNVSWNAVHNLAIQLEVENKADFPSDYKALQELHTIFLTADEKDDPQFRAGQDEITVLLWELDHSREIK